MTWSAVFAGSTPVTLKSFSDLQLAHSLRAAEIEEDLASEAEERRSGLRQELEALVYEVSSVQRELMSEQCDFLMEREHLMTQLARQRFTEELKSHEARVSHAGRLQQLRDEHSRALGALATRLADGTSPEFHRPVNAAAAEAKKTLESLERSIADLKKPPADSAAPPELALLDDKLREIKDEATALARTAKEEEAENRRQLIEMVVALDEDGCRLQEEVAKIQQGSAEREAQHRGELERVVAQITQVRAQRGRLAEQRRARAATVQAEIEKLETDFAAKMGGAARVAARLRGSLESANWRRSQQLANERERASEIAKHLQENSALTIRLSKLESDLRIARGSVATLKKQVTVAIGARRAASLFI
jgi:hypothetical protein